MTLGLFIAIDTICRQMIITQVNCDAAINGLVEKIGDFYKFITEDGRLSKLTSMRDILKSIADQIFDCARFIQNYSETKSFCALVSPMSSLLTYTIPVVRGQIVQECYVGNECYDNKVQRRTRHAHSEPS